MKIPPGKTEAEVLAAIEKAVNILAPSFVFGYYDVEDIKQHGRMKALELLEEDKYDPSLPLENFLYTHIRNRFINLRRDKLRRNDPPCRLCHSGSPCGDDGDHCPKYASWLTRNQAKANIMRPLDLNHISDERENRTRTRATAAQEVEIDELVQRIREELPVELQATFLMMRDGVSIPKAKRVQVENAVKEILRGTIECPSEDD
jgi:DNA-directed RNA polymerase specialized sigma24 family protein